MFLSDGITREEVQLNRKIALDALRVNPAGYKPIKRSLVGGEGQRCAVGAISDALHVPAQLIGPGTLYGLVAKKLGMFGSSFIYDKNDSGKSWQVIAEELESTWNKDKESN